MESICIKENHLAGSSAEKDSPIKLAASQYEERKQRDSQQKYEVRGSYFSDKDDVKQNDAGFVYQYSSHGADQINLFEQCMQSSMVFDEPLKPLSSQQEMNATFAEDVKLLVNDSVAIPLTECQRMLNKTDGAICPLTITTYRSIAFKKLKSNMQARLQAGQIVPVDQISAHFCRSVDLDLLDNRFYYTLVGQYHKRLAEHKLNTKEQALMPSNLRENYSQSLTEVEQTPEYARLLEAVASWYASMELCEDLLDRVQLYGISCYLDEEAAKEKLEKNWRVRGGHDPSDQGGDIDSMVDRSRGYFSSALSYVAANVSHILQQVGIFSAAQSAVSKYAFGFASVHPGYFVSAIVTSILVKMSAENLAKQSVQQHIEIAAGDFALVASNLHNQYTKASQAVANCYAVKDGGKAVQQAIDQLIKGHNKGNEGTLQRFFDQRDLLANRLETESLKISSTEAGTDQKTFSEWEDIQM